MIRLLCIVALSFLLSGCARPEHVPAYHWIDSPTALRDLAARANAVTTVSAQAQIILTRADGQSVRLEGAIAIKPPDSVRLRAWKLGQAVFDLTLTPAGVWVVMPEDPDRKQGMLPASANAARMAHAWAMFSGGFFAADDARVIDIGGFRFRVERRVDGQRITCDIDRATLTPRLYTLSDSSGRKHFTLSEERYDTFSGIPWPTQLIARADGGTIELELHDVELNGELAHGAFVPPRRAEKLQ